MGRGKNPENKHSHQCLHRQQEQSKLRWSKLTSDILFFCSYLSTLSPRLSEASVLVHFHSFSCVATLTSSMTRGTQPPNTNMRLPMTVEEWRLRGRGGIPWMVGLVHDIDSTNRVLWHSLYAPGICFTAHSITKTHISTLQSIQDGRGVKIAGGGVGSPEWLAWSMTPTLQTGYSDSHSMYLASATQHTL